MTLPFQAHDQLSELKSGETCKTRSRILRVKSLPTQRLPEKASATEQAIATAKPCGYTVSLGLGPLENECERIDKDMKVF